MGAAQLLFSSDAIAPDTPETLLALASKHPPASPTLQLPPPPQPTDPTPEATAEDVLAAVSSFRSGSAGGLDGLTLQHYKDLLCGASGDGGRALLIKLTRLVNLMLSGAYNQPDVISSVIGGMGKYQMLVAVMAFLSKPVVAYHQMAIIFLAPEAKYKCTGSEAQNPCPCSDPVYDRSEFTNTLIMEYNLICSKTWLVGFTQSCFQFGVLVGSLLFGMISDRFGRQKPLIFSAVLELLVGIAAAYVKGFYVFTVLRFILGVAVSGTMVCSFVLLMEYLGNEYRATVSALYQIPFNFGHMTLVLISYYVRDYQNLQLWLSFGAAGMMVYFCLLPESPRWLIAQKRTDEAVKLITHAAQFNGMPTATIDSEIRAYQEVVNRTTMRRGTILDLFRTPNLRKFIFAMSCNWFSSSYCFYGVSQYVGHLGGNLFVNVFLSATITALGTLLSIPIMKLVGRKTLLITAQLICGSCMIVLALFKQSSFSVALACIGDVTSFVSFVVVYLYTTELFPTVVRNAAMGFCSMCARIGSMIAPSIVGLKIYGDFIPPICFAVVPFISATVALMLAETKGQHLTNTIEEGENFGKKPATGS